MSFTSSAFAIFLPIVFLLYWFAFGVGMRWCKRQLLLQNLFLLAVSYVFYGWWNWRLLLLIALTSFSSWATAIGIEKDKKNMADVQYRAQSRYLGLV